MTDNELRGKLLKELYERRREEEWISIGANHIHDSEVQEQVRIAQQLAENGLIIFKMISRHIGGNAAQITALGVDVVEGTSPPNIDIKIDRSQTFNIDGSSNVQIGNHNSQTINAGVHALIETINNANASGPEKEEAKSLLRKFLEHPLVAAITGSAIGLLGR